MTNAIKNIRRFARKAGLAAMLAATLVNQSVGAEDGIIVNGIRYPTYEAQRNMEKYGQWNLPQKATEFARAIVSSYEKGEIQSKGSSAVSVAYFVLGEVDKGCEVVSQSSNPDISLSVLQNQYLQSNNTNSAKRVSGKIIQLYEQGRIKEDSCAILSAGKAYNLLGDTKKAIRVYETAIENVNKSRGSADCILYDLTELYLNHGEKAKAKETYSKVKQRDSSLDRRIYGEEQKQLLDDFSKTIQSIGGAIK